MCMPALPDRDAGYPRIARVGLARIFGRRTLNSVSGEACRTAAALEPIRQAVAAGSRKARV
jgi:hypothetical protein